MAYLQIVVKIGSGESDDHGMIGVGRSESVDTGVTPPGMQCHQQITFLILPFGSECDLMSKRAEYTRPARGRNAIAGSTAGIFRRDDEYLHDSKAQVRKPAQMSRRSGV